MTRITGLSTLDSTYFTSEMFGEGSGPIFMDYVNCTGSESRLWGSERDCSSFTHYYGCSHSDDVGVCCQPGILRLSLLLIYLASLSL